MLALNKHKNKSSAAAIVLVVVALVLMASGIYLSLLVTAPVIINPARPIDISKAEPPKLGENQLIIPRIGVDIAYGNDGVAALNRGAWWRYPERGNPTGEGNFIIAAHRFSIQATPQSTVEKSPFYHIDKVTIGDQIFVDFKGKRYAYEVSELKTVQPTSVEIENPSEDGKMTLYSCGLGGARSDRLVVIAKPVGEIDASSVKN